MMKAKIIVTDKLDEEAVKDMRKFADIDVKLDLGLAAIAKCIANKEKMYVQQHSH
jgi:hypothetical protein